MPRPIQATIHTEALRHNLARMRAAAPDAKVWGVVKANAYGHGIERVFDGLRGADGFALLDLQEAQRVRALGWRGPILLLEGVFEARDLELCSRLNLWHTVHCDEQIDMLAMHKTHQPHRVFLKMNSGMNRLGFAPQRFRAAWTRLDALPQVGRDLADDALQRRRRAQGHRAAGARSSARPRATCRASARWPTARRACASAPMPAVRADWIRPGIAVYGSSPGLSRTRHRALGSAADHDAGQPHHRRAAARRPATPWATARSFTADAPLRIGVAACGYADGYPRHCSTGTPVLVDGVRTRMVGRVSMDMITVDLTPVPQAGFGSEVTLWGRAANGAVLAIDEVARAGGHGGLRADVRAGAAGAGRGRLSVMSCRA